MCSLTWYVYPRCGTHIIRDMCFPGGVTHITSDMCSPPGKHISLVMCSLTWQTHIPSDMCFLTWEKHIPNDMCSPTRETNITSDISSPARETDIPCNMCSPTWETIFLVIWLGVTPPGKHVSLMISVPLSGKNAKLCKSLSPVMCVPPPGKHISQRGLVQVQSESVTARLLCIDFRCCLSRTSITRRQRQT